jgi:AAA15 family ATPase/GTPase
MKPWLWLYSLDYRDGGTTMLLQFAVENFRSFGDEALLNLIPAKKTREHKNHILSDENGKRVQSVPAAAIYGANASGKSNLVAAMALARELIVDGTKGEQTIAVSPFRLDASKRLHPSRFEFVIKHDDVLYTYGFLVTAKRVEEEWLFAVYNKQEVRLFERVTKDSTAEIEFGPQIADTKEDRQVLDLVARTTRPNQLFLTEANERNVEKLKPLMRWFRDLLCIVTPDTRYQHLELRAHTDEEFIDALGTFLRQADTGIEQVAAAREKFDPDKLFPGMPSELRKELMSDLNAGENRALFIQDGRQFFTVARGKKLGDDPLLLSLKMQHRTSDGGTIDFDPEDESDGTLRLMHLVPILLDLRCSEKVYVVDELDRSLHPLLCRQFVQAFMDESIRGNSRGQLLLTTHETELLDQELLRRDEIWFIEKDQGGQSSLRSLAEYRVRKDLRIDRGYLNGRFGAIPFLTEDSLAEKEC